MNSPDVRPSRLTWHVILNFWLSVAFVLYASIIYLKPFPPALAGESPLDVPGIRRDDWIIGGTVWAAVICVVMLMHAWRSREAGPSLAPAFAALLPLGVMACVFSASTRNLGFLAAFGIVFALVTAVDAVFGMSAFRATSALFYGILGTLCSGLTCLALFLFFTIVLGCC